ncbi:hypothetical protein DPMN_138001 [Dreissena polymorpha]|uniref:Uncharacterized protein n=1 Tax=Dreissena polymorpha TaxID=45954 RepID=A0A9D4G3H0_DREPO|nr:hypothetical protein DPMN_138001 [Dreissena polymorpha]
MSSDNQISRNGRPGMYLQLSRFGTPRNQPGSNKQFPGYAQSPSQQKLSRQMPSQTFICSRMIAFCRKGAAP